MSKYRLIETKLDDNWDQFVESSPNGTAFACRAYLESIGVPVHAYYCFKSQELMAAFFLLVDNQGEQVVGHDFVIYDGLIYRNHDKLNRSQCGSEQFQTQEAVAKFLIERYQSLRISLHPSIIDIRPFLWVNHGTDMPGYSVNVRYTSHVDISDFSSYACLEDIAIYNQASVSRRQEIRYGLSRGVVVEETDDVTIFVDYYRMTMERQDIKITSIVTEQMRRLVEEIIVKKFGVMMTAKDDSGKIGSMAIYLLDSKRAYFLFGANDPDMRNSHTGTAVLWQAFQVLADRGVKEVDLEGVNSPRRGWFKLSFGGDLRPYYEVCKHA